MVITESDATTKDLEKAKIAKFATAGYSCRRDLKIEGGGGGGVLIYVNEHVPFVEGVGWITEAKGVLEHCSARLYPNYSYDQGLEITGVYRPPNIPNQDYKED